MCNKFRTSVLMLSLLVAGSCVSSSSVYGVTIESDTERNITIRLRRSKTIVELDAERAARGGDEQPVYIRTFVPGTTHGECFDRLDTSDSIWFKPYITKAIGSGQSDIRNESVEEEVFSTQGTDNGMTILLYPGEYGGPNTQMSFSTRANAVKFLRTGHIKIHGQDNVAIIGVSPEGLMSVRRN